MSTETQEINVITLVELKETLGATALKFVDSAKADTRGTVYYGNTKVGIIKKGLLVKDLVAAGETQISAVHNQEIGWVFTIGSGALI